MRESDFEQKVQEQLDELHLRPSASVWYQVEKELRRKKKRRVAFYMSILAGLGLLGYLSISLLSGEPDPVYSNQKAGSSTVEKKTTADQQASSSNTPVPAEQAPANSVEQTAATPAEQNNSLTNINSANQQTRPQVADNKNNTVIYSYKPAKGSTKNQILITQTAPSVQKQSVITDQQVPVVPITDTDKAIAKVDDKKQADTTDVRIDVKNDIAVVKTDEPVSSEPVVATAKKQKDKKIRWGFDVSGGVNFSRDKALSLPGSSLADATFNQGVGNGPLTNGAGPYAAPPVRPPSDVEAGRAFKVGVNAEIKLTKRSSILAGLRYAYLSETIQVGEQYADTLIASSYAGVSNTQDNVREVRAYYGIHQKTYRNNYHFIELPVSYQLQLNRGKKMQVLWNGGVSASYLLATNALVYDTAARGIYYKSSDAFNKLHISFLSGVSLRFGDKKKLQWSVGPEFSMDMTGLLKDDVILKKRYLLYGGLTARVLFPGKKK
jgi:hypothetical protein